MTWIALAPAGGSRRALLAAALLAALFATMEPVTRAPLAMPAVVADRYA